MTTEDTWFFLGAEDEQCGPVTRVELMKLVLQGHVPDRALVWRPGFDGWRPVRDVEELKPEGSDANAAPQKASEKKKASETTPTTAALQQLLGQAQQPASKPTAPKPSAAKTPAKTAPQPKTAAPAPKKPAARRDRTPVAIGAVFAVVAVAAVAGMYRYSSPARKAPPAPPPVAAQAETEIPAEAPPAPPVVRVKNPFDESEVFEFPPGTPPNVARDKVADILMARAMERQKYLEKRSRTSRRR